MQKAQWGLAAGFVFVLLSNAAQAGWWDDMWRDYHRNKNWPQPFVQTDRVATLQPFAVMTNNGWERQNLMGSHHFTPDNQELTEAGKLKVQWILTQAPQQRRTIFVEYAGDAKKMGARIRALQGMASTFLPPDMMADIRTSRMMSEGWPAGEVDRTNIEFQEARPAPVLPAAIAEQ